jgi:hypothetical protein
LRRTSGYIISASIFLLSFAASGQDRIPDDSSKYRFLPTGIRIGTDLISIGKSNYVDYWKGWEVNVDADIYRRFYLTVDYGASTSNFETDNGVYHSQGNYFRVGVDVNFLLKDPDRNMFFLGLRHGHANYLDYSDYSYSDDLYGQVNVSTGNANAVANWKELTVGLRIKIWKFLWMGTTGRLKFAYNGKNQIDLLSYDVPGYGRTIKNNWWGINYQVFVRIPVRTDRQQQLPLSEQ